MYKPQLIIHPKIKVKDRDSGDNEEGSEGVDDGGDCKNKGYGFVSFQASKICNRKYLDLVLCRCLDKSFKCSTFMFQKCFTLQYLLEIVFLQDSESAQKAVEELNGTEMFGKTLYVSRL